MKRVLNYLASRRFAIYLLVITTLIILLSNLLPRILYMSPAEVEALKAERPILYLLSTKLGVTVITRSWLFQIVPLFIFLSILACTAKRFIAYSRKEIILKAPDKGNITHEIRAENIDGCEEKVWGVLRKRKWIKKGDMSMTRQVSAVKGVRGIWGSFVFHIGMDLTLIGILISVAIGFKGKISLTEGFSFKMPDRIRIEAGESPDRFPIKKIALKSFEPVYSSDGFPVDYNADIALLMPDNKIRTGRLQANRPIEIGGYEIIYADGGFAPHIILSASDGKVIQDSIANMAISMPGEKDSFSLPDEGLEVSVELFPDYENINGKHLNKGESPKNPALYVEIERWDKVIGKGFLLPGRPVKFDRYEIEFRELRYWIDAVVSKDPGIDVIFAGFVLIVAGLSIRFILIDKRLWLIIQKENAWVIIKIGGRSSYFPAFFDQELSVLAEDIRQAVDGKYFVNDTEERQI